MELNDNEPSSKFLERTNQNKDINIKDNLNNDNDNSPDKTKRGSSTSDGWHPTIITTLSMSTKEHSDKTQDSERQKHRQQQQSTFDSNQRCNSSMIDPDNVTSGPNLAYLTGGFGYFQFFLACLVFIRYYSLALMTSAGPLLAPEVPFECSIPDYLIPMLNKPENETLDQFLASRCTVPLTNGTEYKCQQFWFNKTETGFTMTDSLNLVCDRAYLKSSFQSAISIGVVFAAFLWGPISDQHGRLYVVRFGFLWSVGWGCVSYFAQSFQLYTIARTLCTFGDAGLIGSLSLIMLELIPINLRGMILIVVYTGWSLGVMFMPFVCDYFLNYKLSTLFTVIVHLITCAPLLLVGESIRWSMVMGNFDYAKKELKRVHKWNGKCPSDFEERFAQAKELYMIISPQSSASNTPQDQQSPIKVLFISIWNSYKRFGEFFQSWRLAFTTIVLIWIAFNGELFYMLFILINSDVGEAKLTNYVVGFLMECLATIIGILMTTYMTRRLSVLSTMIIVSVSCLVLAATYKSHVAISVFAMNFGKIFISNLTSLSWVLGNESFPTTLRQTGLGIAGGLGSFGAVVAPFVRAEFTEMIGFGYVMLILGIIIFLSSWISLFLKETKNSELPDNLNQMADSPDNDGVPSLNDCDINCVHVEAGSSTVTSVFTESTDTQDDKIVNCNTETIS